MTVSSSTNKVSYSGNGTLTTFAYSFKIFDEGDLTVILRASDGTETVQTITTHYTVTGAGSESGGNVEFVTAPTSSQTVVILRELDLNQGLDLVPNDPFPAQSLEESLDKLTFMVQQHDEELGRAIKASKTTTITTVEFTDSASDRASKIMAFDTSGDLDLTQEIGTFQGDWAASTNYGQRDIVKDTNNNNIYIANTAHTSSGSVPLSSNADIAKWDLLVDAASATTSATNAAASATSASTAQTAAETAQTAAETAQTAAETAETNAETAQTAAETAQTAAETAQTAAETAYDNFDDRYLGAKSSDPTVDNDGDALIDGALYFDTTNNVLKVYDLGGTAWNRTTPTSAEQTNIDTVSGISANVTTVAGISANVTTVAGVSADVTTVAGVSSDVTTVAGVSANVTTVAGVSSDVTTVAGISSNVTTVAGISANVTTVAGDTTNIGTVATDLSGSDNIGTVAGSISNVNNVGGSIANVNTVATNLSGVNSFAERYRVGASDPTTSLDEGDLFFNTTSNTYKFYDGSQWNTVNVSGIGSVADDSSPQLGGDLDTNGNNITFGDNDKSIFGAGSDLEIYHDSTTGNSYITESGTGDLVLQGNNMRLENTSGNYYVRAYSGGAVNLYHNNAAKLATTSTGVDVTGTITADTQLALEASSGYANIEMGGPSGAYIDLKSPYSDDYDGRIQYDGSNLKITTNSSQPVLLQHNNSTRLSTSSVGIDVTGELIVDSYNETYAAVTSSSNATTVNCHNGNAFSHTLTENTTFTFSNPPASGTAYSFSIEIIQDASASGYTVTWPSSVDWPAATAPTLTATASAKDVFVFYTRDGGTNWYGFTAGQALG